MTRGKVLRLIVALAAAVGLLYAGSAAAPGNSGPAISEHQRIVEFWTPERVAQAIPRDFVFDPTSGRSELGKPANPGGGHGGGGGGGGDTSTVNGRSWTLGGTVADSTGKVLFEMPKDSGQYWLCSASVVLDPTGNTRSIVLTAGHCVYDNDLDSSGNPGGFAANWMYIPNYDAKPASLNTSGTFCSQTKYGCWTASALTVDTGFANAGGFNTKATLNDFGFAVLKGGGFDNALVESLGTQAIQFSPGAIDTTAWAFGYPAAHKYKGNDLVYCKGLLDTDPLNNNDTYRLGCDMTGGSSGGPWFQPFNDGTPEATETYSLGAGVVMSLNSYGYTGITAMHGPMFNTDTAAVYDAALTAGSDTITP